MNEVHVYVYIATITPATKSRAPPRIARTKIYREHFAWPWSSGSPTPAETPYTGTTVITITITRRWLYTLEKGDGDKSCDRNDSAKLLLARIRARNCPSLVPVRCRDCSAGSRG